MALYNRDNVTATITGEFSSLPAQPKTTILGDNAHAGAPPPTLMVRDVWEAADLGSHTRKFSTALAAHQTKVLVLSSAVGY
jgi:hypothetical protein